MLPGELAPEAGRAGGEAVFWAQRQGDEPPQPGARHPGCVACETSPGTAGVVAGAAGPWPAGSGHSGSPLRAGCPLVPARESAG